MNPSSARELEAALGIRGEVGGAMDAFRTQRQYGASVYGKGGAVLLEARDVVGAEAFDAAVRCYVERNAWAIATPADVEAALADLPEALDLLEEAGALDAD